MKKDLLDVDVTNSQEINNIKEDIIHISSENQYDAHLGTSGMI